MHAEVSIDDYIPSNVFLCIFLNSIYFFDCWYSQNVRNIFFNAEIPQKIDSTN